MQRSYTQAELIRCVDVLKITIPRMNKLNIPLTPQNYAVWYEYSQASNLDLNLTIDNYLNDGTIFTPKINQTLYQTFIAADSSAAMKEIQDSTKNLLMNLVEKISNISSGTDQFSQTLGNCKQALAGDLNVTQLNEIVVHVLQETDAINRSNREMLDSLKVMEQEVSDLKAGVKKLTETAFTDQLTSIANRRAFDQQIESLLDDVHKSPFSLLLMDIDHFKQFNDTHGHDVGDRVLIYVAKLLAKCVRDDDLVARYGGEEFVVLLPATNNQEAVSIADTLRQAIAKHNLTVKDNEKLGHITVSIGVSTATSNDDPQSIVKRADKAMYRSKNLGRNRVSNEYEE